jgi:signal transduction histidine kinase/ActR/RegA family two-component response regulator
LASDSQTGGDYLFLRREFPAAGPEWATLVRLQEEAVDVDPDAPFAPAETPESVPQSDQESAPDPFRSGVRSGARSESAARDAPKQEALQTLAAGLAEYLGHAIAAVDGSAELALQEAPRDPAVRRRFEEISRVVEQVGKLTGELRIFAGRGARTVQRIDPGSLIGQVTESAGCLAFPNVRLSTEIDADLPQIEGDPAQLARVVSSLLDNAVESLPEAGGDVTVRVRRFTAGRDDFAIALEGADLPEGDYLSIEVSDTGFGMDDKLKARILDPFFTTKAPGRGLGLSAVAGIVRNHGGALRLESRPGAGSTFGVCLPLPKQAAARAGGDAAAGIGDGRTVLVVDAQESLRTLARQTFEAEGFRVLTAAEGWEALDVFAKASATIDVVVLDWMMPDLDAEEAFRAIRRIRADTRIIVSGPFPKEQAEQRFGGKKLAAYVRKPLQADNLSECMRQLLEEQAPSSAKAG